MLIYLEESMFKWEGRHHKCHKFLDKHNEIDRAILDLSREGILKIGMIKLKILDKEDNRKYSRHNLSSSDKYN
jgi:hypothetical protein